MIDYFHRHRCRMFPSLVNCCTIDWFTKWPNDALLSVADNSLIEIVPTDSSKRINLATICVLIHEVYYYDRYYYYDKYCYYDRYRNEEHSKIFNFKNIYDIKLQSVEEATTRFFLEMRRRYYTTPSSYLELLKMFKTTFKRRKKEIELLKSKIANGLNVNIIYSFNIII